MTRPISLQSKMEQFRDILDYGWDLGNLITGIPDFKVMECLGFTPQSWSRYRPLIIQYCQNNDLIKYETRDGKRIQTINIRMQYDKKARMWYGKRNYLYFIDESGAYKRMEKEDLEKYNIRWIPMNDYVYTHHTI